MHDMVIILTKDSEVWKFILVLDGATVLSSTTESFSLFLEPLY